VQLILNTEQKYLNNVPTFNPQTLVPWAIRLGYVKKNNLILNQSCFIFDKL